MVKKSAASSSHYPTGLLQQRLFSWAEKSKFNVEFAWFTKKIL